MEKVPNKIEKDTSQFIGGFVRDRGEGRGVRVAKSKIDELPTVDAFEAQQRMDQMEANKRPGRFPEGPSPLKARKSKLACMGIPSAILEAGSPEYARCVRLASAYKKARTKELYIAHGYVSSGAGALLASASLALSASRFLYEIASSAELYPEAKGAVSLPALLKLASGLSDSARQSELSAWELCAREAVVRKRNDASNVMVPWEVQGPSGETKRPRGRPRKESVHEESSQCLVLEAPQRT